MKIGDFVFLLRQREAMMMMAVGKRTTAWLVLWVVAMAVVVEMNGGKCTGQDIDPLEEMKRKLQAAQETVEEAKDNVKAAFDWGFNKFHDLTGLSKEDTLSRANDIAEEGSEKAKEIKNIANDAATNVEKTIDESSASPRRSLLSVEGNFEEAKHKLGGAYSSAKDTVTEQVRKQKDTVGDAYYSARDLVTERVGKGTKERVGEAISSAKDRAVSKGTKDTVGDAYNSARDTMGDAYTSARDTVSERVKATGDAYTSARDTVSERVKATGEAYSSAKDTVTEQAKAKYEAAKEKVSQATMRNHGGEDEVNEL